MTRAGSTLAVVIFGLARCASGQVIEEARPLEPIIGGPCEGCEAVFAGLPGDLTWSAQIAPEHEPGEPMVLQGTVYDQNNQPAPGIIVYAYHTDATGVYPPNEQRQGTPAFRHGRLRGWVQTDARGRYRFLTVRPASYPGRTIPAHVHMHVIEPGCCTYYLDSVHFEDDPLLTSADRATSEEGRGGSGLTTPRREDGVWMVRRDVVLGLRVPGYRR
jgi:protocatechuate 3,4-dioxygenase beta subunit